MLSKAEADWIPVKSHLEITRLKSIQKANADIEAYTPEFQQKKAKAESEQKARIAAAKKAYEGTRS